MLGLATMARSAHWKVLIIAAVLGPAVACSDGRNPLAPGGYAPSPASGAPTSHSRGVLACTASIGQGAAVSTASCTGAGGAAATGGAAETPRAQDDWDGATVTPANVILGRQHVDVTVTLSNVAYNSATGVFSFNTTITNLLNQPMGTTDGTDSVAGQVRIFFYTPPVVYGGTGSMAVSNADGTGFFTSSQAQPYYEYSAPLAPGATTSSRKWQMTLSGSATGFTFALEVDAALPAEGSIRRWTTLFGPAATNPSLTGVFPRTSTDVYAVGQTGALLEYNGSTASGPTSQATSYYAVSGIGSSSVTDIWAVGVGGAALQDTAGSWIAFPSTTTGTTDTLFGIWVAPSGSAFAVGASSTLLHYSNGTWSAMSAPNGTSSTDLYAVWGADTTDVWAVGASGTIWFYDGSSWKKQVSHTSSALRGVWGTPSSTVFAVGDGGTIVANGNGTSWSSMASGTTANLRGVWADTPPMGYTADVYAVGDNGTVQHYNGALWLNMPTPNGTPNLGAIYGTSATNVYVVGDQGVVLQGTQ